MSEFPCLGLLILVLQILQYCQGTMVYFHTEILPLYFYGCFNSVVSELHITALS
jgi:hypothetical protein